MSLKNNSYGMFKINKNLFYLNRIKTGDNTNHIMHEITNVCGFTVGETKLTLNAFQNLAKIVYSTDEDEYELRKRIFRWEVDFLQFKKKELKNYLNGHILIRFFNNLVKFSNDNDDGSFIELLKCIKIDKENGEYDFNW